MKNLAQTINPGILSGDAVTIWQNSAVNNVREARLKGFTHKESESGLQSSEELEIKNGLYQSRYVLSELDKPLLAKVQKGLTDTRTLEILNLMLVELSLRRPFLPSRKEARKTEDLLTLVSAAEWRKARTIYLSYKTVSEKLGIQYRNASALLVRAAETFFNLKMELGGIKNGLTGKVYRVLESFEKDKRGGITFVFTEAFLFDLLKTGNISPFKLLGPYNAKQLQHYAPLMIYLQNVFYNEHLNSGQYKQIKLAHLTQFFTSEENLNRDAKKLFIRPLLNHLAQGYENGIIDFSFKGDRGQPLTEKEYKYLEVSADGRLLTDDLTIFEPTERPRLSSILEHCCLSYTILDRPEFQSVKPLKKKKKKNKNSNKINE